MTQREKAIAGWGMPLPDWVETLVAACEAGSLRKAAEDMDVSAALISLAVRNCHHAKLDYIEKKVTSLAFKNIDCPVLGSITRQECDTTSSRPFMSINPLYIRLYRACRECGHAANKETHHDR